MQKIQSEGNLCYYDRCFNLGEYLFGILVVKQVSLRSVLEYHVDVPFFVNCIPKANDMWVDKLRLYSDLSVE